MTHERTPAKVITKLLVILASLLIIYEQSAS